MIKNILFICFILIGLFGLNEVVHGHNPLKALGITILILLVLALLITFVSKLEDRK